MQAGLHGPLDGTIHLFLTREEPFVWIVAVLVVAVNRKFPVVHLARIGQAADLKWLTRITAIQVKELSAIARPIAVGGICKGLLVELGNDLLDLGLDCFWNCLCIYSILTILWSGKRRPLAKINNYIGDQYGGSAGPS